MKYKIILILLLMTCPLFSYAEVGVIVRTAELRSDSSYVAQIVQSLSPGAEVEVLQRKGGWQQVKLLNNETKGWVRVYQVRTGLVYSSKSDVKIKQTRGGLLSGLSGLFKKRETNAATRSNVVATIGVRGLSEQDLAKAKPNEKEFNLMKRFFANPESATKYAKEADLKSSQVAELENPDNKMKKKRRKKRGRKKS